MYINLREYVNFWGDEKNFCITNTLTNDIYIVDKNYYDFIRSYNNKKIDEIDMRNNKVLEDLIDNDIIFLSNNKLDVESHAKIMEKFYDIFADDKKKFFELSIEVTTKCDNLCRNCTQNCSKFNCMKDCFKDNKIIDIDKTKNVINDFINRGGKSIKFTGGNIFLAETELDNFCEHIRERSEDISIILNLVSIFQYETKINHFIDKYNIEIELSIFDFTNNIKEYYNFFKDFTYIKNIILVKFFLTSEYELPCEILEVIKLNNLSVQINNFFNNDDEYFKLYHSLDNCISINPKYLNSVDYLGKNRCFNGRYYYSVNNNFIPCSKIRNEILGKTLSEVLESKKYNKLLEYVPKNISKCNGCGLIEFCKPCYCFKEYFEQAGNCFE